MKRSDDIKKIVAGIKKSMPYYDIFYYAGTMPIPVNRAKYKPEIFDGRKFNAPSFK